MLTTTCRWTRETGWNLPAGFDGAPQLVLYFGATAQLAAGAPAVCELADRFPRAVICGCSTAGEILGGHIYDESVVAAIVQFESTRVCAAAESCGGTADSEAVGIRIAQKLPVADLRHVVILSDGLAINGTALISGLAKILPADVTITGGLAGDGARFQTTLVGLGQQIQRNQIVAVGFYGPKVVVGCGSRGGWESFGPRRLITRAAGNTLLELDGQPALPLYKRYLGDRAAGLPATGLLFPLELTKNITDTAGLVRTILAVDEARQSLTFAGDMPEGWYARLMKANGDQLVGGAAHAGRAAALANIAGHSALAILVSCVGRRLVLGQRVEEELEAAVQALPAAAQVLGFYSYGEACPSAGTGLSELHNQTMTITLIGEKE